MLVRELIAELQKHSPDALVTVACYEFGFAVVNKISPVVLAPHSSKLARSPHSSSATTHILSDWSPESQQLDAICLGDVEPSVTDANGCGK